MSKKLASGADVICLDVKVGDGAFMKTIAEARELSRIMVAIGRQSNKRVVAFLTGMEQPLGNSIGNRLEVLEAIETLSGHGPGDLEELCVAIAGHMIYLAGLAASPTAGRTQAHANLHNGLALAKFHEFIAAQGGHIGDLNDFVVVREIYPYQAKTSGVIAEIKALPIGLAAMRLGGGRATKTDIIDPMVGIVLRHKLGDEVVVGDVLCHVYANRGFGQDILSLLDEAFVVNDRKVQVPPIITEIIE